MTFKRFLVSFICDGSEVAAVPIVSEDREHAEFLATIWLGEHRPELLQKADRAVARVVPDNIPLF